MMVSRKPLYLVVLMVISLAAFGCTMQSSTQEVIPPGPIEMIVNGDFEIVDEDGFPAGGFRNLGDGKVYIDDSVARSGNSSLYVGKTEGSNNGFGPATSQTGPIVAGKTYQLSMAFRAPEMVNDGNVQFLLRVLASGLPSHVDGFQADWVHPVDSDAPFTASTTDGNPHLYIRPSMIPNMDPDAWHLVSVKITPTVNLTGFTTNFYNESKQNPIWIDDFSLLELE